LYRSTYSIHIVSLVYDLYENLLEESENALSVLHDK